MTGQRRTLAFAAIGLVASAALVTAVVAAGRGEGEAAGAGGACRESVSTAVPQPTAAQLAAAGLDELPVAPTSERVDLVAPPFSHPADVSNPLFPIGALRSAILNGHVDGKPFKTETTLLPGTRIMEWTDGQCAEVLVSQYLAYQDGRIKEVALDLYAQADDGSAWYLGEDVFNYEDGVVADTGGTWFAGTDGPAAMIMPGDPQVGDVYRPENIAGLVFEEVLVRETGRTVAGPRGPVAGAIVVRELHDDGTFEEKVFAPGYGEFFTAGGGDVEALALAVPTDARSGRLPAELQSVSSGADDAFEAALAGRWQKASAAARTVVAAWSAHRQSGSVPARLEAPTSAAVQALTRAVEQRSRTTAAHAAVAVGQACLDLRLQYRPVAEIDLGRFELWLRRLQVDARERDASAVTGDVATVEWIRDRFARALRPADVSRIDTLLRELRDNAAEEDLEAASGTAAELGELVGRLR